MSTVAIGDVHGNFRALDDLLSRIEADICIEDTVVFLGDYIDRGPDSKDCIDRILAFQNTAKGRVVTLIGNHEQWFLRTYKDYTKHSWLLGMEAFETIRSYSFAAESKLREEAEKAGPRLITDNVRLPYEIFFESIPKSHIEFFKSLNVYCRTPDALCVHGGLDPGKGLVEEQRIEDLIWGTGSFPEQYAGRDYIIYGHRGNPIVDDDDWPHPRFIGKTCGIDTICRGVLTALRLPENFVYQSKQFI